MDGAVAERELTPYPLGLRLAGLRVLVVGGGTVATRRVPALLDAGADVVIVAPVLTPALRSLADGGRVTWHDRAFQPSDVDDVWLVQAALDDPVAAAQVSLAAAERRIFCVRADDRHAATAWTPAVTRHGPVTVAVLGGGDPRRAMAVRDRLADVLTGGAAAGDARLGDVRAGRASAGGVRADGAPADGVPTGGAPAGGARAGGVPAGGDPADGDPADGDPADSDPADSDPAGGAPAGGVEAGVGRTRPAPGHVALIGGGPGDPELITVRGRRLLAEATVVVVDRLAPGLLLDELGPDVELIDASKIPYGPQATQEEINRVLVDRASGGHAVARLKGGDPYVFGRGGEELLACIAAGIPVTVVPGVTSALAAASAAGIPVTHRGVAHEFVVVAGHLPPGHPDSLVDWSALGQLRGTVCVLMGLRNLAEIAQALIRAGRAPTTPAAVIQEGTTPGQRVVRAPLVRIAEASGGMRAPALVVVGAVVDVLTGDVLTGGVLTGDGLTSDGLTGGAARRDVSGRRGPRL